MLGRIVRDMGDAARAAGVRIVTGDTKVVERGMVTAVHQHLRHRRDRRRHRDPPGACQVGDVVIVSGTIGDHGMAIMSVREGLEFDTTMSSDCAPLNGLVDAMLGLTRPACAARSDARRPGHLAERDRPCRERRHPDRRAAMPVLPEVAYACEMLGLDPLFVANEGKLVAIVPRSMQTPFWPRCVRIRWARRGDHRRVRGRSSGHGGG